MQKTKHNIHIYLLSLFCLVWIFNNKCSAQSIGNGKDGSPDISGVVNSYTTLIKDANRCDDKLYVANANDFAADDLILIMQMQGAIIDESNTPDYGKITDYDNAGNYEFHSVKSVAGNEITLNYALLNNYSISGETQVIRVPQYQSPVITATLTCPSWDGTTGGVLAIDVQNTLIMNADINVIGKGFRGGEILDGDHVMVIRYDYVAESPDPTWYAKKGEGIAFYGVGSFTSARGAPANGGGGGNIHTTGGGGGSNFGCGGDGGWGYPVDGSGGEKLVYGLGGYAVSYSNADNKIFAGGGGGSGHEHFGNGSSGANGGGIVMLMCDKIEGNGHTVFANGNNSGASGAFGDGAGGAGSGGSILISANQINSSLSVNVGGGFGGSTIGQGFGPGGGGGGGVVWFNSSSLPANISNVNYSGGDHGIAGGTFYGGSDGCDGGILYDLEIPFNDSIRAVRAAFEISNLEKTPTSFTNSSLNATSYYWDFGDGENDSVPNPQHAYLSPGVYLVTLVAYNDMGCTDTAKVSIIAAETSNVFTPNADGINDYFSFFNGMNGSYEVEFDILNRWGQLVFHGSANNPVWDGTFSDKKSPEGTYFYVLTVSDTENNTTTIYKGAITLLR